MMFFEGSTLWEAALILTGHILLVGWFLLSFTVLVQVIRMRRSPAGTAAWLLLVVLVPYLGVPLYLLFGGRKFRRTARTKEDIHLTQPRQKEPVTGTDIEKMLMSYDIPPASAGNRVRLCANGEEVYAELVRLIESSQKSIRICTYVMGRGDVAEDIMSRLTRKASQGLEVLLLMDGVGSLLVPRTLLRKFRKAGGRHAFFLPLHQAPFPGRANLRNHRKIAIADGRFVLAGGTNIAREYIGPEPCAERWTDLSFTLEGPAVRCYAEVFNDDWHFATGQTLPTPMLPAPALQDAGAGMVQVAPSGPDAHGDPIYDAMLTAAFHARKRLWIATPYFVPDDSLALALCLAAHRGVDVRVVVPERSNHRLTDVARATYVRQLQQAGARVLFFPEGMMHAKVVLGDNDVAAVGSANMDMRSLFLNFEIMCLMYSPKETMAVETWLRDLMARSFEPEESTPGTVRELAEGMVRLVSPQL